jgi:ligand-binding sensor domain-containing protein
MWRFLEKAGWLAGVALMFWLVAVVPEPAAGAPPRRMTEFHHRMWTSDNGLGAVFDIQQASNGYLWLTTSTGVFRFDGVRFQSIEEVTNGAVENSEIHSVFLSASGGVWLKTRAAGLLFWKDGRVSVFRDRRCTPALQMEGLAEDRDGSLWVQGSGGFFHMRGAVCEPVGVEQGYPGGFPAAILVDSKGTVWVRTLAGSLLFLPRGQSKFQVLRFAAGAASADFVLAAPAHNAFLHEAPDGAIWLSDDYGLRRITNSAGAPVISSSLGKGHKQSIRFGNFAFGADGSLWAVTDKGIRRFDRLEQWQTPQVVEDSPSESFTAERALSSNTAWKVLIDREGSVWVGTNSGLDQLRRTTLTALTLPPTEEHDFGVAAGDRGSVWIGNRSMPLTRGAANGSMTIFPETRGIMCLRRDRHGTIWSAGGGDSKLWRNSGKGLIPLHYPEEKVGPVISLAFDRNDDLWITTGIGGAYHFSHGEWSRQNEVLRKKPGIIGAMAGDDAGNVWFGFSNYLVRWDGSNYLRFSFPDGSRGVSESTMSVRGDHVWLGGAGGIELFTQGRFYLLRWQNKDLPGRVSGVVETESGELWANGSSGITHVSAAEFARWLRNPTSAISAEHLDAHDGLPAFSAERIPEPSIAESREGRLWFATTKGIAWLDPPKLQENRNRLPPPVMISSIISNGKTYVGSNDLTLPAHTEKLEINYTALSLAVPERVLFRYMLEGVDNEWQDAGTRRQAFYTSLSPGHYRFHVIACNNDGVWNESGASLGFGLAPAFYQTKWFLALGIALIGFLVWVGYMWRVRIVTARLDWQFRERLAERTRIAQELHDTLLQGAQSASMQLSVANDQLAADAPAKPLVTRVLELQARLIEDGRNAVRGLRLSTEEIEGLDQALARVPQKLALQGAADFRVNVEGVPRVLHPVIREEVYSIGREAVANAFRHSRATKIEVAVGYGSDELRVCVQDNGHGIDPQVLDSGREGHWGLSGMQERAHKIGAKLRVSSNAAGGTEVELRVPSRIAFRSQIPVKVPRLLPKKYSDKKDPAASEHERAG